MERVAEEARELGFAILEEIKVGDRRLRQSLSVDHHRKVERRRRRRRRTDRA